MTLSTLQQLSGPDQAPGQNGNGGYSPDQAQALILHPQNEKGGYVDYLRTVRHLVDPEMRTLSAYVRGGHYRTDILRDLGHRYYHHTQWQIRSQSSMLNHRRMALLKEKAWIESMLLGFQKTIDTAEVAAMEQRPRTALRETALSYSASTLKADEHRPITAIIPVTLGEAYDRLTEIMMLVQSLALRIRRAQERDIYYDVGPLLDYWQTPYERRGDLDPTLGPAFMVRLNDIVDISSAHIWRHQAQRINSQSADGDENQAQGADAEESQPKRSMLGRILRR